MIGLSKAGKFANQDVEFKVRYVSYDSDDKISDNDTLFADVIFTF